MSTISRLVQPTTRLGRWSVALLGLGIVVFFGQILIVQSGNQVTNTNGVETLTNPDVKNDDALSLAVVYSIFGSFILGGILGLASLFRRERGVLVYLAVLFGLAALMIFVGGFFSET